MFILLFILDGERDFCDEKVGEVMHICVYILFSVIFEIFLNTCNLPFKYYPYPHLLEINRVLCILNRTHRYTLNRWANKQKLDFIGYCLFAYLHYRL